MISSPPGPWRVPFPPWDAAERNVLDGLRPAAVPPEDAEMLDALTRIFDPAAHLEESGALAYRGPNDARSVLKALMYEPVLNLNGFSSGSVTEDDRASRGQGRTGYQDSLRNGRRVGGGRDRAYRRAGCPEVTVEGLQLCPPSRTTADSRSRAPWSSPSATWGRRRRCGLRLPGGLLSTSSRTGSGASFASGGAGHAGRAHAADEYATIAGLRTHMRQAISFLYRFARAECRPVSPREETGPGRTEEAYGVD